jgi:hypothetical protein
LTVKRCSQQSLVAWVLSAAALLLTAASTVTGMDFVRLSPDKKGFVLDPSGERYVPWGHNYGSVDILERLAKDPGRVERDFAEMKAAGTTVARVHPEMPAFFEGPGQLNAQAVERLKHLLAIAEKSGIYLKITGLACYKMNSRMAWYDALDNEARWQTQELFWSTVATACAGSPAVFCYDLVNEPAAAGKRAEGWYTGRMGDVEFCQRLVLDPSGQSGDDIFREWTTRMVNAIRKHDEKRLITLGMLPFPGAYKAAAEQLDFVSPHLYPKSEKVDEEIELLKKFDFGKPIVIGETFPLSCSADEEREFLLKSRGLAQGWIGHWPDTSPLELAENKKQGNISIEQAIWLSWVELFKKIGPEVTK